MSCEERLAVYKNAYSARLIECLRDTFARTFQALGEDVFDAFAANYIHQYPSTSYTLDRLGDHFIRFLTETWSDQRDTENASMMDSLRFVIDLAKLDYAEAQVFDGPGSERVGQQIGLNTDSSTLPFAICPSVRLEAFDFPVPHLEAPFSALPEPQAVWVVLHRVQYTVRITEMSQVEFEFLAALCRTRDFHQALEDCNATERISTDEMASWFQRWTQRGIIHTLADSREVIS
jgi:hypothetical protein